MYLHLSLPDGNDQQRIGPDVIRVPAQRSLAVAKGVPILTRRFHAPQSIARGCRRCLAMPRPQWHVRA